VSLLVATEGVANDERALRWAEGFGSRLLVVNDDEDEGVGDDGMLISSGQMIFSARVAMFLRSLYWGGQTAVQCKEEINWGVSHHVATRDTGTKSGVPTFQSPPGVRKMGWEGKRDSRLLMSEEVNK
jgi:hypothetical protein